MAQNEQTDPDLEKLANLHEAIVESGRDEVAETIREPDDTEVQDDALAEAEACLRLLERIRLADDADGATDPRTIPETIGRFQVERLLGEGSYGTVYLALDPELNRRVALKIPRPEVVLSPTLRERFLREAEVAAALRHPGVVRVFEAGRADGTLYISSEYCIGKSLAGWLDERSEPLNPRASAAIVSSLADAVQHAHSRGVLHRDLKPGNILLDGKNEQADAAELPGELRITDFGLARFIDAPLRQTQTGAVVGTPAYMAPEQADGQDVTSQSDIYALGCILYELLTGRTPFRADGVLKTLEAVRTQEPTRPTSIVAHVPADLEAICLKCIEKDPTKRYASADRLAEDLNRFLNSEPVSARRVGRVERCWRWGKRNPAVAGAMSLAAISIIVGVSAVFWQWQRAETFGQRADRDRIRTREALDAMTSNQALALLTSQRELSAEQREFLTTVATIYGELAEDDPESVPARERVADAFRRQASIHQRLGNYEAAEVSFEQAIERCRDLSAASQSVEHRRMLCRTMLDLASLQYRRRNWELAERFLLPLEKLTSELVTDNAEPEDLRQRAKFFDSLANLYRKTNRLSQTEEPRKQAIELREQLLRSEPDNERDKRFLSISYNNFGNDLAAQGNVKGAEPWLQKSLDLKRELASAHPDKAQHQSELAVGLAQLGVIRYRMHEMEGVKDLMDQAMAINQKLVARYPMDQSYAEELAFCCINYTTILNAFGDEQAIETAARAVAAWQHRVDYTPDEANPRVRLAGAYLSQGNVLRDHSQHEKAIATYTDAISTIEDKRLDQSNPGVRNILMNVYWGRATTHGLRGNPSAAIADWDRAISFAPNQVKLQLRLARATSLVQSGDVQGGLDTVDKLTGSDQQDKFVLYNAACVMALVSTKPRTKPRPRTRQAQPSLCSRVP